jgi:cation diffusion facilitator family transporter
MTPSANTREQAEWAKHTVALSSVFASIFLTVMKLLVGLATGSLGILADAAHSGLDLVAALITFLAVRVSGRPADLEHNYGHGKIENLSALSETLLLLGTCAWIVTEALHRLVGSEANVEVNAWAFITMGSAIAIDLVRSRALRNAARKYHSQALEADALNFTTDIWSSAAVIVGLCLVWLSRQLHIPWLENADAVAALVVAGVVAYVSLQLGRHTVNDLMDTVSPELRERVADAAQVPGVLSVDRVRVRRSGPETFADVTVAVARAATFEDADVVASNAEEAIRAAVPGADVVVHADPLRDKNEDAVSTVRLLAARRGFGAHNIRVARRDDQSSLELDLEVDRDLSLGQADAEVEAFEAAVKQALPDVSRVVIHAEPIESEVAVSRPSQEDEQRVWEALRALPKDAAVDCRPSNVEINREGGRLDLSFECRLDPNAPLTEAHAAAEQVERYLRDTLPDLGRVVIHLEPAGPAERR